MNDSDLVTSTNPRYQWLYEDYDPNITVDKWLELFADSDFKENIFKVLNGLYLSTNRCASCRQLADRFGGSPNFYNNNASAFAKKVQAKTNCPFPKDEHGENKYWPILFIGKRDDGEDKDRFVWKLRKNLEAALDKYLQDPSNRFVKDVSSIMSTSFNLSDKGNNLADQYSTSYYVEKLKKYKNIIFHGAPGTGKSYLAREIANQLTGKTNLLLDNATQINDQVEFVQFHPTYDYTDFIEGLRPCCEEGTDKIVFERKDGIFKAFCKKAARSLKEYNVVKESNKKKVSDIKGKISSFIDDALDKEKVFTTATSNEFTIQNADDDSIYISSKSSVIKPILKLSLDLIYELLAKEIPLSKVKNIREYCGRNNNNQEDSYVFTLVNEIRKYSYIDKLDSNLELKNYVFIIDEISRGEISKIFGELFFSIEKGYRGEKGRVKTQYQNLVDENDPFAKGFYVPENVYIIATMNEIDRSIEFMDFAMQRRFKKINITADISMHRMNISKLRQEVMVAINTAILNTEGLGEKYQLGGSFFNDESVSLQELWDDDLSCLLKDYLQGIDPDSTKYELLKSVYFNAIKIG